MVHVHQGLEQCQDLNIRAPFTIMVDATGIDVCVNATYSHMASYKQISVCSHVTDNATTLFCSSDPVMMCAKPT